MKNPNTCFVGNLILSTQNDNVTVLLKVSLNERQLHLFSVGST